MKPMSIKLRLSLLVSLLTLAIILVVSVATWVELGESLLRSLDKILRATGDAIVATFEENDSWQERENDFRSIISSGNADDSVWCRVWIDGSEEELFASGLTNFPRRESLLELLPEEAPEVGQTSTFSAATEIDPDRMRPYRVLWLRHPIDHGVVNVLVGRSSHHVHHVLVEFYQLLLIVGTSLMLLAFLATPFLVSWGLRPIARASARLQKITHRSLKQDRERSETAPELKPFLAALDDMLARLDQAMRQQEQFIADAAHELRTPVAVVKSTLQTIQLQPRTVTEYEESIEETLQDVGRLEHLIEQLLSLARLETPEAMRTCQEVRLDAMLGETVGIFQARAAQQGSQILFQNPPVTRLQGDAGQLRRLFSNLIDNALQHGPARGTIRVKLEQGTDHQACVSIHDEGGQIPAEALAHLFDRFYRVDSSRAQASGGSGLGMAIAREIVHRHGGDIEVTSNPEAGTCVVVRLPIT